MFINGIQCDTCCKIHNKNMHQNPFPKEWVSLQQDQQELHFCSIHCLHAWVEKQTIVLNESVDPSRLELWKEVTVVRAEMIEIYPDPSAMTKAERILHWIERTKWEIENDGKSPEISRLSVLIDDIEELCRKE